MTKSITPEMIAAWRTLQAYACGGPETSGVINAINVLDNSDFMVPIENAGLCTYQVGGGYHSPPEYCEAEIDGVDEYCPKHQAVADMDAQLDPADTATHQQSGPVISTQSAMNGKIYRSDGSVLPAPSEES